MKQFKIIVPGGLNTDIAGLGVDRLLAAGELTLGGKLYIGPGGKSRNIAQMAAAYLGKDQVAVIGRTSKDPYGFWKVPLEALENAGVDTTHVIRLDFDEAGGKYPGIALIPVDKNGKNQIYVLPGVNADFSPEDIDKAEELFAESSARKIMVLTLEVPIETVQYAIEKAHKNNIRIILDSGGIRGSQDELLGEKIFMLKPNEHEAEILTGIQIHDFETAGLAAAKLLDKGICFVFITHGAKGGYLFGEGLGKHIAIPSHAEGEVCDETGCGDQVTAVLAACKSEDMDVVRSAELAIRAGTMQYYRAGIQPVSRQELLGDMEGK
jgi:ribokinase